MPAKLALDSASVISRIDGVEAGVWPSGPTRKTITAAGGVGGLLLGFGLVFLFANPVSSRTEIVADAVAATERDHAPVIEPVASPSVESHRTSSEAFGMFRGKSLQEAIRSIQERKQSEV